MQISETVANAIHAHLDMLRATDANAERAAERKRNQILDAMPMSAKTEMGLVARALERLTA